MSIVVASFYQFVPLDNLDSLRSQLLELGGDGHLKGTLILAPEGINATVAGPPMAIEALIDTLRQMPQFQGLERLEYKESQHQTPPLPTLQSSHQTGNCHLQTRGYQPSRHRRNLHSSNRLESTYLKSRRDPHRYSQ